MGRDVEVVILFADVVGSTQLYEQLGDDKARETVARCLEIMRSVTEEHSGSVIKTMGDEVMSTFPVADDAMNAAKQMQETISSDASLRHRRRPRRDSNRLPFRSRRAGKSRHLRFGRPYGQPNDEPGKSAADHYDVRDGRSAFRRVARDGAADRCRGASEVRRMKSLSSRSSGSLTRRRACCRLLVSASLSAGRNVSG